MPSRLLHADDFDRTIRRFAQQFTEPYDDLSPLAIIGMQTRGVYIAKRIRDRIREFRGVEVPLGVLDITFYRDDFRSLDKVPTAKITEIPFDLDGLDIILVDDVLYTGRTVRAAMEALMSFGRPHRLRFCCMVDRGHRELPISADFVGITVPTYTTERVQVRLAELDGEDGVVVTEGA